MHNTSQGNHRLFNKLMIKTNPLLISSNKKADDYYNIPKQSGPGRSNTYGDENAYYENNQTFEYRSPTQEKNKNSNFLNRFKTVRKSVIDVYTF